MVTLLFCAFSVMAEPTLYHLSIQDHRMSPAALNVTAGEEFVVEVRNLDNGSEEVESNQLKFERIVGPKKTVKIPFKALPAGTYDLYGDYHADVCRAVITASPKAAETAPPPPAAPVVAPPTVTSPGTSAD